VLAKIKPQPRHPVRPGPKQAGEDARQEPRHPVSVFPVLQQVQIVIPVQGINRRQQIGS